ncbi:MAG: sulfatase-like hydrolase/transferase [Myxococcales bacterium]|nr:sulfatase-like hydrolase/transferase [Myxococcales bacterium]
MAALAIAAVGLATSLAPLATDLPVGIHWPISLLLLGILASLPLRRGRWSGVGLGVVGLASLALALTAPGRLEAPTRFALEDAAPLAQHLLRGARLALDADGDGFSPALGGGDCDDADPARHPLAMDLPGDGVDQDCRGGDAAPAPPPPAGLAAHADLPPTLRRRRNLLLVTVDTLRPDHTSLYGYARDTTPHLKSLARRGLVFDRAYTPAGSTRFALPALFGGRPLADQDLERWGNLFHFPSTGAMLFERLRGAGWHTEAHLPEALAQGMWFGLQAGFDAYRAYPQARLDARSDAFLAVTAAEAIEGAPRDRPWALWVHLVDPHEPYLAAPTDSFGADTRDRYDDEVRASDAALGRLVAALNASRQAADTLVVVTADHGEELEEHGARFHGKQLFEESVRVPWLIAVPGAAGSVRVPHPVSLIDLPETLADLLDLPPGPAGGGQSQAGALVGQPAPPRPVFIENPAQVERPRDRQAALVDGALKAIFSPRDGRLRLFDLAADPEERHDLALAPPPALAALGDALRAELDRQDQRELARLLAHRRASAPPRGNPVPAAPGLVWLGGQVDAHRFGGQDWFRARAWLRASDATRPDYRVVFTVRPPGGPLTRRWIVRPVLDAYPTPSWPAGERIEVTRVLHFGNARGPHVVEVSLLAPDGRPAFGPVQIGRVDVR